MIYYISFEYILWISLKDSIINVFPCATFEVPMDFKSMSSYRTSTLNVRSEQFFIFVSGFCYREVHWKMACTFVEFISSHSSVKEIVFSFNRWISTWFPFADIKIRFKLGVQSALKLLIWNSINPLKPKISLIYCPKPHFLGFPSRTVCKNAENAKYKFIMDRVQFNFHKGLKSNSF